MLEGFDQFSHVATNTGVERLEGRRSAPHTDASELDDEAALTPDTRGAERVVWYASYRRSRMDAKRLATEREVMAVL